MSEKGPLIVLMIVLILTVSALIVGVAGERSPVAAARSQEFQRLVGGLGFGPAASLSGCAAAFDPRLCPRCHGDLGPLPGGGVFCPEHACSLFDYPAPGPH